MFDPARMPGAGRGARLLLRVCFFSVVLNFGTNTTCAQEASAKCPPATAVKNVHDTYASADVVDPYRWLEDQNSQETRGWIEQE